MCSSDLEVTAVTDQRVNGQLVIMDHISQGVAGLEQAGALDDHDGLRASEVQPRRHRPCLALTADLYQVQCGAAAQSFIPLTQCGVGNPHDMSDPQAGEEAQEIIGRKHSSVAGPPCRGTVARTSVFFLSQPENLQIDQNKLT